MKVELRPGNFPGVSPSAARFSVMLAWYATPETLGSNPANDSVSNPRASRRRSFANSVARLFSNARVIACSKLNVETPGLVFAAPGTCCAPVIGTDGAVLCEGGPPVWPALEPGWPVASDGDDC